MSNEKILKDLENVGITKQEGGSTDEIICIVDRSGSMCRIREDAEGGLNSFINEQKKVGKANLTIVEFDNRIDVLCEQVDINEAEEYKLEPRGGTSLLDAIGTVVGELEKYSTEDGKTIVVILTDGGENSSVEWTRDKIFEVINKRKEDGWEFMFLASGQDAIKVGAAYGFDANSTVSFADTSRGCTAAYEVGTVYTSSLRTMPKDAALARKKDFVDANIDTLSEKGAIKK